ncbi:MAG TPA: ubiquinol-cytochrome c reductase cytochrome b subunit [Streptosporangiaceae bacterium]
MERRLRSIAGGIDDRFGAAGFAKRAAKKAFPDHWSFFLGEIALYSFIILLLTGTFLTLFFKPSMTEVVYHGSYIHLDGVKMSEAYSSTLGISFDVRGGLLIRQIHHWAALLFVAAIGLHALRIFFTGAFRKPREINWLIGTALFALAAFEGFAGYSLPDDLLSGTGLRIADGIMLSVPVVGTYLSFFVFGGQYPGDIFISRLYVAHVLIIPGLLLALITAHLMIVWHQGHAQWPGKKERDRNEVGEPLYPVFMAKTAALFFFVFGILAVFGAIAQINPIWLFGPYNPSISSNTSQPDWYIGFLEGALRLMPAWETDFAGHTIVWNVFVPGVVLVLAFFLIMGCYPFFEQWATGDTRSHQVLDRPRNMPARTALGVAILAMATDLQLAGSDDVIAFHLNMPVEDLVWALRAGFFVLPAIAFVLTRRACIALQRRDRRRLRQGTEFGITAVHEGTAYAAVARPASGEERAVMEARRPDELFMPIPRHLVPLPTPRRAFAQLRARVNHFYVLSRLETPSAGPPPGTDGQASPAGPRGAASDHAPGTDGQVISRPGQEERIE